MKSSRIMDFRVCLTLILQEDTFYRTDQATYDSRLQSESNGFPPGYFLLFE